MTQTEVELYGFMIVLTITSDPTDPEVIIKIDISNVFNTTCRALTLDVISGSVSRNYVCDLKKGQPIPTCDTLTKLWAIVRRP